MNNYVPIYAYAKQLGTSTQNVYRWIREGKFDTNDLTTEVVTIERLRIRESAQPREKNTTTQKIKTSKDTTQA